MKTELEKKRLQILAGIARGERDVAEGKVITHEEAKKIMAKWLE